VWLVVRGFDNVGALAWVDEVAGSVKFWGNTETYRIYDSLKKREASK
jgi:hypothetical protein